jgi:8-oxo-dGTP pyrophosphatase MutT (NUDIX family)
VNNGNKPINKAAVIYAYDPATKLLLATHRKNDRNAWGLPGGKQEDNESILECAVRELEEETPYILYNLSGIHHLCDMPEFDYMVSVFIVDVKYLRPMISDNQEYNYAWLAPQFVLNGPFADFNERLFKIVFPKDE